MSNAIRIAHGVFGRVALLDMDASLVRHAHPHCHVLIKASGADTQFSVRDAMADLTDETAVLINAWEPHAYVHDPARPRTTILALYVEPRWLSSFRTNWEASGTPGFFNSRIGDLTGRIRGLAQELSALMLAEPAAAEAHQALLSELMIRVIERFAAWRTVGLNDARANSWADWRVRRAIATIRREPGAITDISRLARESGLSRAHFFRLFQQSTHMSPRMFTNMIRFEGAVAEVLNGGRTMAEVSDELGFSVPCHFTRFFRDHAGAPPREFRAIARLQKAA